MSNDGRPTDSTTGSGAPDHEPVPHYEVRVQGRLATRWSAWFDGLRIDALADGTTAIRGAVVDQAALHGLLQKLRDVGIPLLSLTQVPPDGAPAREVAEPTDRHPTNNQPGAPS